MDNIKNVCIGSLLLLLVVCSFCTNIYINQLEADKKTAVADSLMCQSKISEQNNHIVQLQADEAIKIKKLKEVEKQIKLNSLDAQKSSLAIMANDQPMTCEEWASYAASEAQKMGID